MKGLALLQKVQGLQRLQADLAKRRAAAAAATSDADGARVERLKSLDVPDFVHALSPKWDAPRHLHQLCDAFERIKRGDTVRLCVSLPPRHGKTETAIHFIAQLLLLYPEELIFYVTYGAAQSRNKSKMARTLAERAGVRIDPKSRALNDWATVEGGGLLATGVDGPIKGRGPNRLFLVDDPIKDRQAAESSLIRDTTYDWISDAFGRLTPGVSMIVIHTRMHEDDLIGRLEKLRTHAGLPAWQVINIPAISGGDVFDDHARALWPERRPLSFFRDLLDTGTSAYDWESQYLGRPRPRGSQLFKGVHHFSVLPTKYKIGKGLDLAYTAKTRADRSVSLVLYQEGDDFYVVDVVSRQKEINDLVPELVAQTAVFPGNYRFSASSTEKGIGQLSKLLPPDSIRINAVQAMTDKFTHAQRSSSLWNAGHILVPDAQAQAQLKALGRDVSWVEPFLKVMERFTGLNDPEDDECDALFNAIDTFPAKAKPPVTGGGFYPGIQHDDLPAGYG